MTRTKLVLAGLLAGAMALGTACKSNTAAERGEPAEPTQQGGTTGTGEMDTGGTTPGGTTPDGTGGTGDVGGEDFGGAGDIDMTGADDDFGGSGTLNPENEGVGGLGDDVTDEGRIEDGTGTGGSGYEEEDFEGSQRFGGDSFPGDNERVNRPQGRD